MHRSNNGHPSTAPLRVAVDATCWQNGRGYGRYVRSLLSTLLRLDTHNRYTFFVDSEQGIVDLPPAADVRVVHTSTPTTVAASASGRRSASDMWRMSRALSAPEFDLLLFPTVYSYVPVVSRAKKVVMIMDTIAETFPQLTLPRPSARLAWWAKVSLARWQADSLVTLSEYTRHKLSQRFNVSPKRVWVVGAAPDAAFRVLPDRSLTPRLRALGLNPSDRKLTYVGGFNPHKNVDALVAAFGRVASLPGMDDLRLVLVGDYQGDVFHSYYGKIKAQVDELNLANRVVFTGFLPDEEVAVLLNASTLLALPSLMEGFGLPAVEAAACGCPVVATTESPLPLLLGEGGLYADPGDGRQLEEALLAVLSSPDKQRRMREAGLRAVREITWEASAQQMLRVLQGAAAA